MAVKNLFICLIFLYSLCRRLVRLVWKVAGRLTFYLSYKLAKDTVMKTFLKTRTGFLSDVIFQVQYTTVE